MKRNTKARSGPGFGNRSREMPRCAGARECLVDGSAASLLGSLAPATNALNNLRFAYPRTQVCCVRYKEIKVPLGRQGQCGCLVTSQRSGRGAEHGLWAPAAGLCRALGRCGGPCQRACGMGPSCLAGPYFILALLLDVNSLWHCWQLSAGFSWIACGLLYFQNTRNDCANGRRHLGSNLHFPESQPSRKLLLWAVVSAQPKPELIRLYFGNSKPLSSFRDLSHDG